jgi:hypothetical protein
LLIAHVDLGSELAFELPSQLADAHEAAAALTADQVRSALETYRAPSHSVPNPTAEGFAGRLAADCRAWGFDDQHDAQRSFVKVASKLAPPR